MSDKLLPLVNASGFAFQLAVEEAVRTSGLKNEHAWSIASREHGWRDGDTSKFIDLVLTRGQVHLAIECKRMRGDNGAELVFLVPDPAQGRRAEPRRWLRTIYARDEASRRFAAHAVVSLHNFQLDPRSWESGFCVVRGSSDRDKPMLDRIAAELARATDALVEQQLRAEGVDPPLGSLVKLTGSPWLSVPVIVTTARLFVCRFDPAVVPLADGILPEGAGVWDEVPFVRYRKSLDAPPLRKAEDLTALEKTSQRTAAIVRATHLTQWLKEFVIEPADRQL